MTDRFKNYEHSEIVAGVRYVLTIEERLIDEVAGKFNDPKLEADIVSRHVRGNSWAWCDVTVTAVTQYGGSIFTGAAHLSECSYRDAADFMQPAGYYRDLCKEARRDLAKRLDDAAAARQLMREVAGQTTNIYAENEVRVHASNVCIKCGEVFSEPDPCCCDDGGYWDVVVSERGETVRVHEGGICHNCHKNFQHYSRAYEEVE